MTPLDASNAVSVELFVDGISQGESLTAPYAVNYVVNKTGTIELYAVATETLTPATDGTPAITVSRRSATVRVIGALGTAPTVDAVQVPTSAVTLGNTVTLSVTAGDSDGTITSVNFYNGDVLLGTCLLYTSPSPRDGLLSRMPSSA